MYCVCRPLSQNVHCVPLLMAIWDRMKRDVDDDDKEEEANATFAKIFCFNLLLVSPISLIRSFY